MAKDLLGVLCTPSVYLMNKLKFKGKFAVIGISILVLTFGIIYLLISNLESQAEFSRKETLGITYINPLKDLLYEMQSDRYKKLSSEGNNSANISKLISKIDKIDENLNTSLAVGSDWQTIKNDWKSAEIYDNQTVVIGKVIGLISHINDTSNLVLDPDLDTYYIMDAYSLKLPNLLEKINLAKVNVINITIVPN